MARNTFVCGTGCLMLVLLVQPGVSTLRHQLMKKLDSDMKPSTFVVEKLDVRSEIGCAAECLQDARCESFGSGPGGSCRVVDSVLTGPDLLPAAGWSYYGLSPPILQDPPNTTEDPPTTTEDPPTTTEDPPTTTEDPQTTTEDPPTTTEDPPTTTEDPPTTTEDPPTTTRDPPTTTGDPPTTTEDPPTTTQEPNIARTLLSCSDPRLTYHDDAGLSAHSCAELSPANVPDNPLPVDQYGSQTIMIKKKHSGGDALFAHLYISLAGHLPPPPGASILMSVILQGCYPRNTYSWNAVSGAANFRLDGNGGVLASKSAGWHTINTDQAFTFSHVFPNVDTYPTLDTVYFGPVLRPTVDVGPGDWQTCVTGFLVKYV